VDVTVKPVEGENQWDLVDLLGRTMGRIAEHPAKHFTIHPDGQALETMEGIGGAKGECRKLAYTWDGH